MLRKFMSTAHAWIAHQLRGRPGLLISASHYVVQTCLWCLWSKGSSGICPHTLYLVYFALPFHFASPLCRLATGRGRGLGLFTSITSVSSSDTFSSSSASLLVLLASIPFLFPLSRKSGPCCTTSQLTSAIRLILDTATHRQKGILIRGHIFISLW